MKAVLLFLVSLFTFTMSVQRSGAQVYATSQTSSATGLCIGCYVSNAGNAVDAPITNYETMNLTVTVLGAYLKQRFTFPAPASTNSYAGIMVEDVNLIALGATALGSMSITTYKDGISNGDLTLGSGMTILLVGGSTQYKMEFRPTAQFDELEVRFSAGIVGALSSMRVYYAYYKTTAPLPIELVSFNAETASDKVNLNWVTATEQNNDYFTIEKSTDAVNFEELTTVDGAGSSSAMRQYSCEDKFPAGGLNYYRLKQTDFNGEFEYFPLTSANYKSSGISCSVYPNPSKGEFVMESTAAGDYLVRNAAGQQIRTFSVNEGNNHSVKIEGLANGIYFLTGTNGDSVVNKKLVVNN